jgi:hypothetical protein
VNKGGKPLFTFDRLLIEVYNGIDSIFRGNPVTEVSHQMTLHPIAIAIVLFVFGLLAIPPMLSLIRDRRFFLAGLMFITLASFVAAGIVATTVPPGTV